MRGGSQPVWTLHAAQRVLQHKLDPALVLEIAADAIRAGFGRRQRVRVLRGDVVVVICRRTIITAFRKDERGRTRRSKRKKSKHGSR